MTCVLGKIGLGVRDRHAYSLDHGLHGSRTTPRMEPVTSANKKLEARNTARMTKTGANNL